MRKVLWAGAVLGSVVLLLELTGVLVWLLAGNPAPMPSTPLPTGPKVKIAVLGDIQKGLANFSNLLGVVGREQADLILQTGDLVAENDPGHYRLVRLAYARSGLKVPFLVTPGNHDLKADPGLFEREIGPMDRTFVLGDVAFLLVQNAWGNPPPDPKDLERRIAAAGPHRTVVLAMHQPPFDLQGAPKPEYAGFLKWLEKSGVAYVFSGHVHAYHRKQVGEAVVIVNGVGGDYDSWQLGQKVYATILEIDGLTMKDRAIELPPEHGFLENVEHLVLGHASELGRRHPFLAWGGSLLMVLGVGWAFRTIFAMREPFKPAAG